MKVLVTGVSGQLGHDVMNELAKRGYEGIGSGMEEVYAGIQDGTSVETMQMCIRDRWYLVMHVFKREESTLMKLQNLM